MSQILQLACFSALLVGLGLTSACTHFDHKPLSSESNAIAFYSRTLTDSALKSFFETNGQISVWPRESWDLNSLTVAAFYFHPEIAWARSKWHTAQAGKITAGQRPNPNLTFTPGFNSSSIGTGGTPWILGGVMDIPIETMGKRRFRMAQAAHIGEMARFDLANTAWLVRSRVRSSLLSLQAAEETAALLREQAGNLERLSQLVERQWQAGEVSPVEVSIARVSQQNAQLSVKDAERQATEARGQLAESIGVPLRALDSIKLAFSDLTDWPTNLTRGAVQRQAVLNRADILAGLEEYAASESALQLQVAKQFPDIHLRPGYQLDQTDNKWSLGLSLDLPLLHRNQGPISEALARRAEVAARFTSIQAKAIGEIDRVTAVFFAALDQASVADNILINLRDRSSAMTRMYEAGEVDRLAVVAAQSDYLHGDLSRLKAHIQVQQALAALENAVQSPVLMPIQSQQLELSAKNPGGVRP